MWVVSRDWWPQNARPHQDRPIPITSTYIIRLNKLRRGGSPTNISTMNRFEPTKAEKQKSRRVSTFLGASTWEGIISWLCLSTQEGQLTHNARAHACRRAASGLWQNRKEQVTSCSRPPSFGLLFAGNLSFFRSHHRRFKEINVIFAGFCPKPGKYVSQSGVRQITENQNDKLRTGGGIFNLTPKRCHGVSWLN